MDEGIAKSIAANIVSIVKAQTQISFIENKGLVGLEEKRRDNAIKKQLGFDIFEYERRIAAWLELLDFPLKTSNFTLYHSYNTENNI